jgi:transposase
MVLVDGSGVPLGTTLHAASEAEVRAIRETLQTIRVPRNGPGHPRTKPRRIIADKAYDCDAFRFAMLMRGIEVIAPHRRNRVRRKLQDGRALRRYRHRWKVERTFAWLQNFRRLVVRWDRSAKSFLAFLHVACLIITLRF